MRQGLRRAVARAAVEQHGCPLGQAVHLHFKARSEKVHVDGSGQMAAAEFFRRADVHNGQARGRLPQQGCGLVNAGFPDFGSLDGSGAEQQQYQAETAQQAHDGS